LYLRALLVLLVVLLVRATGQVEKIHRRVKIQDDVM
jgi:hypothetical protein